MSASLHNIHCYAHSRLAVRYLSSNVCLFGVRLALNPADNQFLQAFQRVQARLGVDQRGAGNRYFLHGLLNRRLNWVGV